MPTLREVISEVAGPQAFEEIMMPLSLALAGRCAGVLRIGGECRGAELEVERVRAHGGIVFQSLEDIPDANESDEFDTLALVRWSGEGGT